MTGRYDVDRFIKQEEIKDEKAFPFLLGNNPFPTEVPFGLKNFPLGRINMEKESATIDNVPFSIDLRESEINFLNNKLTEFTKDKEPELMWVCGQRGVGKTALLQYYFDKPLIKDELVKKSFLWYVSYDKHEAVSFLYNPSKYILEHLVQNLIRENIENEIFHEALTSAIFKFLVSTEFNTYKPYLANAFSDSEIEGIKAGIAQEGRNYFKNLLIKANDKEIDNIIFLLEQCRNSKILNIDLDYFNNFIKPFVKRRLEPTFLTEKSTKSILEPKIKAQQESSLINTIKLLTSGAFDHFILVLDQIDIPWDKSKNAHKRKKDFFDGLSSFVRQLKDAGLILIIAVMEGAAEEIRDYTNTNEEADRIAFAKHTLTIPRIESVEQVKTILKEYLSKNRYRKENEKQARELEEKHSLSDGLFPFDDTACSEILKNSTRKTVDNILNIAAQCADCVFDAYENAETPEEKEKYSVITGLIVKEFLS